MRILLYPHYRDVDHTVEPLFDSDVARAIKPSIAEIVKSHSDASGNHDLIEEDFLELCCQVEIEYEDEENILDELKDEPARLRLGSTIVPKRKSDHEE